MQIQLDRTTWTLGELIPDGEGGFGKVYFASNEQTKDAVAKLVEKKPGATREMVIGDYLSAEQYTNVVPVLDSGEHESFWVLVMPRAEMSLAQRLSEAKPLEFEECLSILTDVAQALASIENKVVHRDLKPGNVLRLNGTWCLADFGIARYANATTATDTRKLSVSEPYAAPEQWLMEQAGSPADVYAFGVMAYEMIVGRRPFSGPLQADYREQHLTIMPPQMTGGNSRLRSIIMECLTKAPEARPRPTNLLLRLQKASHEPVLQSSLRLAEFDAAVVERRAREHAAMRAWDERAAKRMRLFESSKALFDPIARPLHEEISDNVTTAKFTEHPRSLFVVELDGGAKLGLSRPELADDWDGPFDVISTAVISVNLAYPNQRGWFGRSHSLWFCDPVTAGEYGWYETAFMEDARADLTPFSRLPREAEKFFAEENGCKVAWPVSKVDTDDLTEFLERWLGWLNWAAAGLLDRPDKPERVEGTWRKS